MRNKLYFLHNIINCCMLSIMYLHYNLLLIGILVVVCEIKAQNETLSTSVIDAYTGLSDEEFTKLCREFNVQVATPIVDSKMKTITINFKPTEPSLSACFPYFYIYMKQKGREVEKARVMFNYVKMRASYKFENVTCGSYKIVIIPCVKDWRCTQMHINVPGFVNMTSVDCRRGTSLPLKNQIATFHGPENSVLIAIMFLLSTLLVTVSVLMYRHYHIVRKRNRNNVDVLYEQGIVKYEDKEKDTEIIQVYLLHYYDNSVENNAELVKDFLLKSSYFRITQIEDALPIILLDKDKWLNEVLKIGKSHEKSNKKKIIIVNSEKPENMDVNEIENEVFYELIKKLQRDWEKSRNNYENIFIIHFNKSFAELEELKHISERDRYSIPDYLIDLCLNLIAGSEKIMHETETQLRQLLAQHPVRDLKSQMGIQSL